YVGGEINDGGGPLGGMARWDGATWDYDPFGLLYSVEDMLVFNGELVVMGDFGGGTTLSSWDGTTWDDMDAWGDIYATDMTTDGVNLYATGFMEFIGDTYVSHVARWDGTQWYGMGGGLTDEFGEPYDAYGETIHAWDGKVAVAGYFAEAGGQALPNFAVWSGSSWGPLGSDPDFFSGEAIPLVLGDHDGDLLVFNGYSFVYTWNGFFWNGIGWGGSVYCAGDYAGDLIFGGYFREMIDVRAENVARYDGSAWQALAAGDGIFGDADQVHAWNGLLVATGDAQSRFGDDVEGALIAAWNGSDWVDLGLGAQATGVSTIDDMVTFQGDLVVNGNIDSAGGTPCNSFARYDGTSWSPLGDSVTNSGGSGMIVIDGVLYAVASTPNRVVARYEPGTDSWLQLGDAPPGYVFYDLGAYQGDLIASGSFPSIDGVAANRIARFDGTTWRPMGAGVEGGVFEMHEADGKLYVGGTVAMAGGAPAAAIAAWDGSNWSALGDGLYGRVHALRSHGVDLYAAGAFSLAGGNPASNIARWDGAAWSILGSGLDDDGLDMAVFDGKLFVVGDFTTAGGGFNAGIAGWTAPTGTGAVDEPRVRGATLLSLSPGRPNPFQNGTTFAFEMPRAGNVVMDVLDVRGRRVAQRIEHGLAPGSQVLHWDGKGHDRRGVPAGVYFVRVRAAGVEEMRRVTVVR
ncbi:T9SS type A sorting domain-containing protein, partial [bacterium]|nr:T9SS type A sorting domain-containing protein [bacterium]